MRYPQIKNMSVADLRSRLVELDLHLPVDDEVSAVGALSVPIEIHDSHAGVLRAPNRFAILPMEGWDGTSEGHPTDLVRRRWQRFGASGCGLVWCEATAVRHDGRANPNQLVVAEHTVDELAELRGLLDPAQLGGLQLTHSGRWARPRGEPVPRVAYAHPLLDRRLPVGDVHVLHDDELDELVEDYVSAAVFAARAGFDFVDIKHCHGYLLHELLTAHDRPGPYGGELSGRTRFLSSVVAGIRAAVPSLAIAVRLSVFDMSPFSAGPDEVGRPEATGDYHLAFGGDGTGTGVDLSATHELLSLLEDLGIGLVSTTAGSPYYNPHIQRPAYFPPSDGYAAPEDPLVGVVRQIRATSELVAAHPDITFVGSGYSYLQEWLPNVAQAVVAAGDVDVVGIGRMALSYPELAADVLADRELRRRSICRTFSDCTTAPRNGLVSGCFPIDPFYKEHPHRVLLSSVKADERRRRRS